MKKIFLISILLFSLTGCSATTNNKSENTAILPILGIGKSNNQPKAIVRYETELRSVSLKGITSNVDSLKGQSIKVEVSKGEFLKGIEIIKGK